MSNLFSKLFWGLLILLAGPTLAILASWNSLPGDTLYPVKRGLETVALLIASPSYAARSSLQSDLVGRRASEATKVLASRNSTDGLVELQAQIAAARTETLEAKDAAAQKQAAQKLLNQLQETSQQLEESKQTLALAPTSPSSSTNSYSPPSQGGTTVINHTVTNTEVVNRTVVNQVVVEQPVYITVTPAPTHTTTQPTTPSPPTSSPPPTSPDTVAAINQTQVQIQSTIDQLNNIINQSEVDIQENQTTEESRNHGQERKEEKDDRESRRNDRHDN